VKLQSTAAVIFLDDADMIFVEVTNVLTSGVRRIKRTVTT